MKCKAIHTTACILASAALFASCEGLRNSEKMPDFQDSKVQVDPCFKNGGLATNDITGNLMVRIHRDDSKAVTAYAITALFEKPETVNPLWENFVQNRGKYREKSKLSRKDQIKAGNAKGASALSKVPALREAPNFNITLTDGPAGTIPISDVKSEMTVKDKKFAQATKTIREANNDSGTLSQDLKWTKESVLGIKAFNARTKSEEGKEAANGQPPMALDHPPEWTSFLIDGQTGAVTADNLGAAANGMKFVIPVDQDMKIKVEGIDKDLAANETVGMFVFAEKRVPTKYAEPQTISRLAVSCVKNDTYLTIPSKEMLADLAGAKPGDSVDGWLTVGLLKSGSTDDVTAENGQRLNYWVMAGDKIPVKFTTAKKEEKK